MDGTLKKTRETRTIRDSVHEPIQQCPDSKPYLIRSFFKQRHRQIRSAGSMLHPFRNSALILSFSTRIVPLYVSVGNVGIRA